HSPRDPVSALRRLIRIGGGSDPDCLSWLHFLELAAKRARVEALRVDLALELERVTQLHELVGVAGVAIFATKPAPAGRSHRPDKRQRPARAPPDVAARVNLEIFDALLRLDQRTISGKLGDSDERGGGRILEQHGEGPGLIFAFYSPIVKSLDSPAGSPLE